MSISTAGAGYTLQAATATLGPADSKYVYGGPRSVECGDVTFRPRPQCLSLGQASTVTVVAMDVYGNRLANETVIFASNVAASSFAVNGMQTDANGYAQTTYLPNHAGLQTLTATLGLHSLSTEVNVLVPVCHGAPLLPSVPGLFAGANTGDVVVNDFTNDGAIDVAALDANTIAVYPGNGNGTFGAPIITPCSGAPTAMAGGRFDNDTNVDLMTGDSQGITFFPGNGDGTFGTPVSAMSTVVSPTQVTVTDLNQDTFLDVLTVDPNSSALAVYMNTGALWSSGVTYATGSPLQSNHAFTVGDFTGDGNEDVIATSSQGGANGDGYVLLWTGNGDGTLRAPVDVYDFNGNGQPLAPLHGNLNADPNLDMITLNGAGLFAVFVNQGNGLFTAPTTYPLSGVAAGALTDINNDGLLDMVAGDGNVAAQVFLGEGNALFQGSPRPTRVPSHFRRNLPISTATAS